jgi:hypothetical protein
MREPISKVVTDPTEKVGNQKRRLVAPGRLGSAYGRDPQRQGRLVLPHQIHFAGEPPRRRNRTPHQPEEHIEEERETAASNESGGGRGNRRPREHAAASPDDNNQPFDREQLVIYDPREGNFDYVAFTSHPFTGLVSANLKRVRNRDLQAESGFCVVSNGNEIIYSRLTYGGRGIRDDIDLSYGMESATYVGRDEVQNFLLLHNPNKTSDYTIRGIFHSHPPLTNPGGFSQGDIENYESNMLTQLSLKPRPDLFEGVFITSRVGKELKTDLFMFQAVQGRPTNTIYQAYDFNMLSLKQQQEVLERSGFRTLVVPIPMKSGHADLTKLAEALKG